MFTKKSKLLKEIKVIIKNNQSYDSQKDNIQFIINNCNYSDDNFKMKLGKLFADLIMNEQYDKKNLSLKYYSSPMKDWEEKMLHFMDLEFNPNQYVDGNNILYFTINNHKNIALKLLTKNIDLYSFSNIVINEKNIMKPAFYSIPCCFYALDDLKLLEAFVKAGLDLDKTFVMSNELEETLLLRAIENKNKKSITFLLDNNAFPNKNVKISLLYTAKQSPLLFAIYHFEGAIPLLLEAGADYKKETHIIISGHQPLTAFEYAKHISATAYSLIKSFDEKNKLSKNNIINQPKKQNIKSIL